MAFTDNSFTNIAVGTALTVVEHDGAVRHGTFISAKNGTLTIYWTTYDKNMSWSYGKVSLVRIGGGSLNADGSLKEPPIIDAD